MRYAVVLLAVFSLVLVGCGGGTPEEKMEKATACVADGDFDKAIDICKGLIEDEEVSEEIKAAAKTLQLGAEAKKAAADAAKALEDAVDG